MADQNANQAQDQEKNDQLESLPAIVQALVDNIQGQRARLSALEERESTRSLNPDRVRVIELEKMVEQLSEIVQNLLADMQALKESVSVLESRENTRTLNTDRVRIIDLEKKFEQLVDTLSKRGEKS